MQALENRIPPPLVFIGCALVMFLLARDVPSLTSLTTVKIMLILALYLLASACSLSGFLAFKQQKTTINPLKPEQASHLVTTGAFQITRNPMYLGLAVMLLAWAIYLQSWLSLCGVALFIGYIQYFQILPEERAMQQLFGDAFLQYKNRVRRWI